jgi:DnaK suppressor protein
MADETMQRKDELRKMLIELRYEIVGKIAQEMETKLDEDPRISRLTAMDAGDLSQFDLDDDIDFALLNMHIERLREVESALNRLENGTYGICDDCGTSIKVERLRVLPFTTYCVQCQKKREQVGQVGKLKQVKKGEEFDV